MNEVDDLLQQVLAVRQQKAFLINKLSCVIWKLPTLCRQNATAGSGSETGFEHVADTEEDRDTLLQLLFTFGESQILAKKNRPLCTTFQPARITGANQYRRSSGR